MISNLNRINILHKYYTKIKIKLLIVLLFLINASNSFALESCSEAWSGRNHPNLLPPTLDYNGLFSQESVILDVTKTSWQTSKPAITLQANKSVLVEMFTSGLYTPKVSYTALYRIDPRFGRSQVFLSRTINSTPIYDVTNLNNLLANPNYSFLQRVEALNNYFKYSSRSQINMNAGDIVNITISSSNFASPYPDPSTTDILGVYTQNALNNSIIYANASSLCANSNGTLSQCKEGVFIVNPDNDKTFFGLPNNTSVIEKLMQNCSSVSTNNLCKYQDGVGMVITFNGATIKNANTPFTTINSTSKLFRYTATTPGVLDFISPVSINGMFKGLSNEITSYWKDKISADIIFNSATSLNFLYFGSYVMDIKLGGATPPIVSENTNINGLSVYYVISTTPPTSNVRGTLITGNTINFNAPSSGGQIYFRVENNANFLGNIQINFAGYVGNDDISAFLLNNLVIPLSSSFETLSQLVYTNLDSNELGVLPIARATMILFVVIYTLYFLAGAIKITSMELIKIIAKISMVNSLLFYSTSWNYLNTYLFPIFFKGANYIISGSVSGAGSVDNIFGFIDPMINFYFNGDMWWLIFIEFICFWKGTTIMAIILIIAIINLTLSLLDVIVKYMLAILSICVLISLAPLFIILILFETTRPIFDNWMSSLVRYTLEPVFIFLFLLMIQEILMLILPKALLTAVWTQVIPLAVSFSIGGLEINVYIPGCPGVAFYTPNLTNFISAFSATFIVFSLSVMARGFINYSESIISAITSTQGLPSTSFSPASKVEQFIGMDEVNKSMGVARK